MATRNTISRIRSRIDELAERHTPSGAPILIAVRDGPMGLRAGIVEERKATLRGFQRPVRRGEFTEIV